MRQFQTHVFNSKFYKTLLWQRAKIVKIIASMFFLPFSDSYKLKKQNLNVLELNVIILYQEFFRLKPISCISQPIWLNQGLPKQVAMAFWGNFCRLKSHCWQFQKDLTLCTFYLIYNNSVSTNFSFGTNHLPYCSISARIKWVKVNYTWI